MKTQRILTLHKVDINHYARKEQKMLWKAYICFHHSDIVRSPCTKGQWHGKMFPFDDIIMLEKKTEMLFMWLFYMNEGLNTSQTVLYEIF